MQESDAPISLYPYGVPEKKNKISYIIKQEAGAPLTSRKNAMEVNGAQKLFGYKNGINCSPLVQHKKKMYTGL